MQSRRSVAAVLMAVPCSWALAATVSAHEWCVPDTLNTYAPSSPVITNVTFNTIDRSSPVEDKELYVHALESTEVEVAATYEFSMTYTLDVAFCPQYAIRVWIDWGQDESFETPGDTVVAVDGESTGTVTASITVPPGASAGLTRMRVAMKMETICGHSPIMACPEPEEFGWHGEIEDYNVIVLVASESDCENGIDDDDDGLVDCLDDDCVADPDADCDGDGVTNGIDCAPADGGAFALPGEVPFLAAWREGADAAVLAWDDVSPEAGVETTTDVVSGRIGELTTADRWSFATCLVAGTGDLEARDERRSAGPSDGFWYLVRAGNACGSGAIARGSFGARRDVPPDVCP